MPNFHVHWLVAWHALDGIASPARDGRNAYLKAGQFFRKKIHDAFDKIAKVEDVDPFFAALPGARGDWESRLGATPEVVEQISCFAACMLGACGPDFWTVTTESGFGIYPDTASHHFDLGHYNRTHQQFRVSIDALRSEPETDANRAQRNLERSYFLGMAMHVATDLVLHQLVNVYAGAYSLLEKKVWNNEHDTVIADLWNVHNKVEHFWDTYARYRFLSDYTLERPIFDGDIDWLAPLKFPVVDSLVDKARNIKDEATRNAVLARLVSNNPKRHAGKREKVGGEEVQDDLRRTVELPLVFPARAADRILGEWRGQAALAPFIYDRVVNGTTGAFPAALLYQEAIDEKTSLQMKRDGLNERRKLSYFSSQKNTGAFNWACLNYLTYRICPDLGRLRDLQNGLVFGREGFYHLEALKAFGQCAIEAASRFGAALVGAYNSQNPDGLAEVGRFWHLDSGLGFEVQEVASHLAQEIVTRLDFIHVFDQRITGDNNSGPAYSRANDAGKKYLTGKKDESGDFTSGDKLEAFPVRPRSEFGSLELVAEPDKKAYLDRVVVGSERKSHRGELRFEAPASSPGEGVLALEDRTTQAWLDAFFARKESPKSLRHPFSTVEEEGRRKLGVQPVKHRLTLELRIPIADIGDETGMFLYCDENTGLRKAETSAAHGWATKDKLIAWSSEAEKAGRLRVFTARILLNFVKENERKTEAGKWNNVVPYDDSKRFYGRNFAIATGRSHVLHPAGGGNCFDPTADFTQYPTVSPTEEIFLTIFPLVRSPWGVFDAFSKDTVTRQDFDLIGVRNISYVEWKKVVLFYELDGEGRAAQLSRCLIDGLLVPVKPEQ